MVDLVLAVAIFIGVLSFLGFLMVLFDIPEDK